MQKRSFIRITGALCFLALLSGLALYSYGRSLWFPVYRSVIGASTLQQTLARYGEPARLRLYPRFEAAGASYPPERITLIGLKQEKQLELWAFNDEHWRFIHSYPIQAASGNTGPKLREGDRQVPEGRYRITGLNPNSSYHLSMQLDYPNAFDQQHAEQEGRTEPGSDIFIHGKAVSIGCLAMGDTAIEELFILAADTGIAQAQVLIAPFDARQKSLLPVPASSPVWLTTLYRDLERDLRPFHHTTP